MQLHEDGTLVVSATDLVGFLECDHLVTLEQARARGDLERPFRDDPQLELVQKRGYEHEQRYIDALEAEGRTVVEMTLRDPKTPDELRAAEAETLAAMRAGTRRDLPGHVLRRPLARAPGLPGPARRPPVGPRAVELRHRGHQARPAGQGGGDDPDVRLRGPARAAPGPPARDHLRSSPAIASRIPTGSTTTPPTSGPPSAGSRRACSRRARGAARRPTRSPSTTAASARGGRCAWTAAAPTTTSRSSPGPPRSSAASSSTPRSTTLPSWPTLGAGPRVRGMQARILDRLRRQAALQLEQREDGVDRYELIPPNPDEPGKGLAALPPPSRARRVLRHRGGPVGAGRRARVPVRLDRGDAARRARLPRPLGPRPGGGEGDARGLRGPRDGAPPAGPRDARLPLRRLRVGRPQAADAAPRHPRGRDRRPAPRPRPRQPLRPRRPPGHPRQRRELLDQEARDVLHARARGPASRTPASRWSSTSAGWRSRIPRSSTPSPPTTATTASPTCCSATGWRSAASRRSRRTPSGTRRRGAAAGAGTDGEPTRRSARRSWRSAGARTRCATGVPVDRAERTPEQQGRWLLAALLDWHRREAKPQWWDHFRLVEAPMDDLVADAHGARPACASSSDLGDGPRSPSIHRYAFDPAQDTKIVRGQGVPRRLATGGRRRLGQDDGRRSSGSIPLAGTVDLKRNPASRTRSR